MKLSWLLFVVAGCAVATPPPAPPRKTNLELRMTPATLPNGLRIVLVSDPNASEVQVTMRYQVGANDDPQGQEGIAHLVEHLMFQQVLGGQSLWSKLENATSFFNAFTTPDATTYVTRATPEHLDEILSVEAVRVGFRCTTITDAVFARERDVVLNELNLREPSRDILIALHRAIYPEGHPYGRSATPASVAAVTREQACAFADAHYAPGNAVLVVSGPITVERLEASLRKFLGKVPKRDAQPPVTVPMVPAKQRRVDARVPIDFNGYLVAWPLPADPALRLKVAAAATYLSSTLATVLDASAQGFTFGDGGAPMYGVLIALDDTDKRTPTEILRKIDEAVNAAPLAFQFSRPEWLANVAFDRIKQSATYSMFAHLEEGSNRDTQIAASVLAGRDPNDAIFAQADALRALSAEQLSEMARANLRYNQATVAVLSPSDPNKHGLRPKLAAPVHDMGQRRDPPDPADAKKPQLDTLPKHAMTGMRKRTLANGLDVILLPVTSIPTVEMRLVFASGTAADSAARRGAALAAGKALEWDPRHLNDYLLFVAGGGTQDVAVDADHTVFSARGIDMHLDLLLAGLRRLVRDGRISVENVQAIRDGALRSDEDDVLADAWRASMFGAEHPYAQQNAVSTALTLDDVKAFRKQHHTPDNATLVIAGHFDADLADRWIDYLFADWAGAAPDRRAIATTPKPASFAKDDDTRAQVFAAIAIPATRGDHAQQLVAAAMFETIARDVRHQLGVSYDIDAGLDESRLAKTYVLAGDIDAAHTREALELVQARLAALHSDADATARAFITARKRVLATLLRSTSSASELADRVERDVELARPPLSDLEAAEAVNRLTIDAMGPSLEDLDLTQAAIILRGPRTTIDDAFAAVGRTPTRFATPLDDEDPLKTPSELPKLQSDEETFRLSDIEDPITLQTAPLGSRWLVGAYAGYTLGRAVSHDASGYSVGADVGYRFTRTMAAGLHASIAFLDGTYPPESVIRDPIEISMRPVRVGAFLQASAYDQLWGNIFVGASMVRVTDDGMSESKTGLGYGIEGGFDVLKLAGNRLTLYGRLDTELASSASYAAFTVGLGYRR